MKKFLLGVFSFIVLLLICIYVFIPGDVEIAKTEYIRSSADEAYKALNNESNWKKWWPEIGVIKKNNTGTELFFYKGYRFELTTQSGNSIELKIISDLSVADSRIVVNKYNSDSVVVNWRCDIKTGISPGKRVLKFREAKEIKKDMSDILSQLRTFLEEKKNIISPKDATSSENKQ
jgi:hypothetical protein